MKVIRPIKTG